MTIKKKFLWFLKLISMKKNKVIKLSWAPKLSDLRIGEIKSNISAFESSVNSKFFLRSILFNPSLKIVEGKYWYTAILSASDKGKIEISKNIIKITKISFSSNFLVKKKEVSNLKFFNKKIIWIMKKK